MNTEQVRKEIVFGVMKDLRERGIFLSPELRVVRHAVNSNITKVLERIE